MAGPLGERASLPAIEGRFLLPRFWGIWVAAGLLRLMSLLPYAGRVILGGVIGRGLFLIMGRRRRIAQVNLSLCFPEMSEQRRARLLREHFESLGIALVEMGAAWWAPDHRLEGLVTVRGREHLETALARGRGAILMSAHFTSLEMGLRLMSREQYGYAVYRPQNNALLDVLIQRGRLRVRGGLIARDDIRGLLAALKANHPVWYPPDQDYGRRHSVFADFFRQPAATITTTARFARMSGAAVVPFYYHRLPGFRGYEVVMHPPLEDFPTGDPVADARRQNAVLEEEIRRSPAQYLWIHRRFKTRPPEQPDVYAGDPR
ncbi:MAG: LpxL/LpxP family Kdo(2)-lipid IV(A) lauroyl/palmitoleoyl acyltransferase [Gammaproteobacteria bacterium]|nr:LpxL/LpxP family Kdo(2)-lipid IV(A) lauroyl/palmitoleoyl acyltransferase [Gammaproteobacteria bacterium]